MDHPELAAEVDYIAVHILPYWEGIPVELPQGAAGDTAVEYVFKRYYELQNCIPIKPSSLPRWVGLQTVRRKSRYRIAGESGQVLREFLNRATAENVIYYVVEAFDQPWKIKLEGTAGAYWGLFNADRQPKFPMEGDVLANPTWRNWGQRRGHTQYHSDGGFPVHAEKLETAR